MALRADDVDLGRDRDLVARYQAGDPSAFDALYSQYFDRLHRYCRKHTRSDHEAEEVAQEAFVKALRAMPRFQGERNFYPWLTVIARRTAIDGHRKASRLELTDEPDLPTVGLDVDHLFDAVDHDHLRQAMANLGPRHREVLELREAQAMSYAEIAEHLDVPVTTVEALLHRARKALKREYLAVGGERRALWGLPLLGWLSQKASGLKARGIDRWIELTAAAAPVVAGAATVAVVLAPHADTTPIDTAAAPVVATVDAAAPAGAVGDPVVLDEPVAATTSASDLGGVDGGTTAAAPTLQAGPVADVHLGTAGREQAEAEAKDMPTTVEAGPVTAGADLIPARQAGGELSGSPVRRIVTSLSAIDDLGAD